ncbi:MAG TPA: Pr6Pr family membrane protein [Paracoccaceae bacterium]|nr:Pr6Pr family membrane protein [Paracoccaceae bacterium]
MPMPMPMSTSKPMPMSARLSALALFVIAGMSMRLQFDVALARQGGGSVTATLWQMAGYFTILTNLLVALAMAAVAMRWRIGAVHAAALTVAILGVGIVYHLLLARLWAPQGLAWWADQGLHTAVPLGMLAWWWAFAPKTIGRRDIPAFLVWPLAYGASALARGAATGFWPYPFLDADALGWSQVGLNLVAMAAGFAALGAVLILAARAQSASPSSSRR